MSTALEFAIQVAHQAGATLQDVFRLSGTVASFKSDHSFVTQADIASDQIITTAIREQYPTDGIISEESKNQLTEITPALWIIDPLDGTTNFSLGLQIWGVLITRLLAGQPDLTVQYFPLLNELYTAQRGNGAWLNGHPIQSRPPDPSQPYGFFACCSRTHLRYQISIRYKPRILGCAAYSFSMLARGTALIGLEITPKIWDIAGAWLLVKEAGGVIQSWEGDDPFPLHAGIDYSRSNYPTLAASTPELLDMARKQINPKTLRT